MLTIAISSDLAAEHPAFMTAIAQRGHTVDVVDAAGRVDHARAASSGDGGQRGPVPVGESGS